MERWQSEAVGSPCVGTSCRANARSARRPGSGGELMGLVAELRWGIESLFRPHWRWVGSGIEVAHFCPTDSFDDRFGRIATQPNMHNYREIGPPTH